MNGVGEPRKKERKNNIKYSSEYFSRCLCMFVTKVHFFLLIHSLIGVASDWLKWRMTKKGWREKERESKGNKR